MVDYQASCEEAAWFAYVQRPAAVSWLLPRKDSKKVARLISAVSASWEDDSDLPTECGSSYESLVGAARDAGGPGLPQLARQGSLTNTQTFVFPTCGLTVKQGVIEAAPEIWRVSPFVHCAPDNSCAIAFVGSLLNVQASGRGIGGHSAAAAAALARQGSLERGADMGALTAAVVLAMYQHDSELVLLSELQGQYAFVIVDSKRGAFAARDASGTETLFYRIADDGSAAFASSEGAIPEAEHAGAPGGEWRELPPGHYVCGRTPKLHQFALTPEQLQARRGEAPRRHHLAGEGGRRASLDYHGGGRQPRGLEGDMFGFAMDGVDG
ncbi:asparagine synthetase-related protein [Monoraphidium neglectum]|uniref:Asparagine synthetase-related protein n=1 Tax=Monoraphidium neglectum TaxID=145388 RepID=A0A0D2MW97_9CHLO|nr:asparagine synthetase-related protein [Monoraphidium neglectum]KIY98570.1 asparagine synthetase-related protein [Monoraphidium neglectum]|eukprot:XP_013897590.1 asparagine synthetase-related protein [Monoraphidium neglectum]